MDALGEQHLEPGREVAAHEARLACRFGGQLREALLGDRVAIEADEEALGPQALGDQPRVTGAADGAVDGHVARTRVEQLEHLVREDGLVRCGHVKQSDQVAR